MPAPTATIAIPSCNGAAHIAALLRSLLAQTQPDVALLLVDDASTDDTVAVATATAGARLQVVRHTQRVGLAANFAHAASLVTTPCFALAHQDDVYAPTWLATLLAALERAPQAAFAHCTATAIDGDGNALTAAAERFKHGLARKAAGADPVRLFQLLWRGNFVCCPSVLFRTAAFRELGGFDTSLSFALDWELWFRCARQGRPFVTVLEPLVHYRRHAGNATRAATRSLRRFEEELAVLQAAHAHGHAAGWLREPEPPGRALRNNLVNEAFEDLRAGDRAACRDKLRFVAERLPQLRRDPFVLALRALARCGRVGVHALGLGRALAVRLGLG